jgi:hypothetical protein
VSKNHLTQSATSTHQLDFRVTAAGSELLDGVTVSDENEDQTETDEDTA